MKVEWQIAVQKILYRPFPTKNIENVRRYQYLGDLTIDSPCGLDLSLSSSVRVDPDTEVLNDAP